jgi:DNA primase
MHTCSRQDRPDVGADAEGGEKSSQVDFLAGGDGSAGGPASWKLQTSKHPDKVQSLAVYPDHIYCYGCGYIHTGVYALTDLLHLSCDEVDAVESHYHTDSIDAYRERAAQEARLDPLPSALADIYHQMLWAGPRGHRMYWLLERGLSEDTVKAARLGHDGQRFVIPLFSETGDLISLRFRRDDEYLDEVSPATSGIKGRNGLYLRRAVMRTTGALLLCEGELDAVAVADGHQRSQATNARAGP